MVAKDARPKTYFHFVLHINVLIYNVLNAVNGYFAFTVHKLSK